MRLLILAPFDSINAEEDAQVLNARGYDAVTFYHLHEPSYAHNRNAVPTARQAQHNVVLELLEGALAVIHPDAKPGMITEVATVCRYMRLPMVRYEDLPACPPMSEEVIDAHNCVADPLGLGGMHVAHAAQLLQAEDPIAKALDRAAEIRRSQADKREAKMAVVREAAPSPSRWGRKRAADDADGRRFSLATARGNALLGGRLAGKRWVRFVAAVRKAMAWADRHLSGLKNPMVREQQQAPVRPYAMGGEAVSTTG
jgi:hypothetical protein